MGLLERALGAPAGRRTSRAIAGTAVVMALVLLGAACTKPTGPSPWPGGQWRPRAETYGIVTVNDVPIPMSDGVTLRANIGFPADRTSGQRAPGTFPVLLSQNPYGAGPPDQYFVKRGYIFVMMDVRGTTPRSDAPVTPDGQFFGPRQAQDGIEAVDYVAHRLEGSNGIVGLVGCSFLGINQFFTAGKLGPGSPVKAMIPACAGMGYETFFDGGVPSATLGAFALPGPDSRIALNGAFAKQLTDEIAAGGDAAYRRTFWQAREALANVSRIVDNGIPALLWSGWKALEVQSAVDLYSAFQNAAAGRDPYGPMVAGQPVTGRYQLVVGAGAHAAGLDYAFQLQWLDRWLRNEQTGIDRTSTPLHVYEVNSQRWLNTDRLPIAPTRPYYLGAPGALSATVPAPGSASLRYAPPAQSGATLAFTSAPVTETMAIAGPVAATVYAASTTPDALLIATLEDVGPRGATTKISDGTLVGSVRGIDDTRSWKEADGRVTKPYHPYDTSTPLTPGRPERFDIKMDSIVWSLAAGHSLRLVLSTQAPASACGSLTSLLNAVGPAVPCNPTNPQKAALAGGTYTVFRGGDRASVVNVPLVKPTDLAATLACTTPTSYSVAEPMGWDGGTHGSRDRTADTAACRGV